MGLGHPREPMCTNPGNVEPGTAYKKKEKRKKKKEKRKKKKEKRKKKKEKRGNYRNYEGA